MAFILPVNQYQYQLYQDRIKANKRINHRTIEIEKVKKAYLLPKDLLHSAKESVDKSSRKRPINNADKIYAQITGTGKIINETI